MRYIYLLVSAVLALSVLLFVGSFIYLDKINHKTYHYDIKSKGKLVGTVRIDRFLTENKIIFKSSRLTPSDPLYTELRERIVLDKNYVLESYTKERIEGRNADIAYLENFKDLISFVARSGSVFACIENIPIKKETFVFDEESPVTYFPLLENYNFSRGRSQGFNAISCLQYWSLPPMKRFITLTSINDEHITVDSKKIDSENLLLKIRDYPQGALWVTKHDRTLLRLELPGSGLTIDRTFRAPVQRSKPVESKPSGYISKDLIFKNGLTELSATLTLPDINGKYKTVLFAPGPGPANRDCAGLFSSIADSLTRSGYATLRFDKPGVGSSSGDYSSETMSRDLEDLRSALSLLRSQETVDQNNIIIIGFSTGCVNALDLALKENGIKAVVMIAPLRRKSPDDKDNIVSMQNLAKQYRWSSEYLDLVYRSLQETKEKVTSSQSDWAYILGKKCFLGQLRQDINGSPIEFNGLSKMPILTLQHKDDSGIYAESAEYFDKKLAECGNLKHTLTYYVYLGPFFGQIKSDGTSRDYYLTDKEVINNIKGWLERALNT